VKIQNTYRADIDGLRGLSVVMVILYHLFPDFLHYGYLGVDIFFVISGYVVTQALLSNLKNNGYSGLGIFYTNRIKRILPALYFNIFIALILSGLFIPPIELSSILKTAASSVIGLSNIALLIAGFDYFSPDIGLNPFLHTWSLGVEEQFYFIFPFLVLFGMYFFNQKNLYKVLSRILLVFFLASFSLWIFLKLNSPIEAFYNPLARFWELLVGSIIFINKENLKIKSIQISNLVQILIVILFLLIHLILPATQIFEILSNTIAVLVSGLFIISGLRVIKLNKIFENRMIVYLGKISYSLYLSHYIIFILFDWTIGLNQALNPVIALIVTILLSLSSYYFIETPLRQVKLSNIKILIFASFSCCVLLIFTYLMFTSFSGALFLGDKNKYNDLWLKEDFPVSDTIIGTHRECHLEYSDELNDEIFRKCKTNKAYEKTIFLLGNSHAQHLLPMLEIVSERNKYNYTALTISNCRMLPAAQIILGINYRYDLCKQYFEKSFDYIYENAIFGDIILIGSRGLFESIDDNLKSNVVIGNRRISSKKAYELTLSSFNEKSSLLKSKGVSLVFVGPSPTFDESPAQCSNEWYRNEKVCDIFVSELADEIDFFDATISNLSSKNVHSFYPHKFLCGSTLCTQEIDNKLLYRDKHHLSIFGSEYLVTGFVELINSVGWQENYLPNDGI